MIWTTVNSGPYMDSLAQLLRPRQDADGTYVFSAPLGQEGAMPMIYLQDFGRYVLWVLQHPERSAGMTIGVATEHVTFPHLVESFTAVTGKPARYEDLPVEEWVQRVFGGLPNGINTKIGGSDDDTLMTYGDNFSHWMNVYKANVIKKDYALLDEILPDRVKSVGEWIQRTGWQGEERALLKDYAERMGTK